MIRNKIPSIVAVLTVLVAFGLVYLPHTVQAQAAREVKELVKLNAGIPIEDNLIALKGRSVTVILLSGTQITGIVKEVKNNQLHLERLSLKEFFDALIRIDHISAIEARVKLQ
jgi:hypothetical protein